MIMVTLDEVYHIKGEPAHARELSIDYSTKSYTGDMIERELEALGSEEPID